MSYEQDRKKIEIDFASLDKLTGNLDEVLEANCIWAESDLESYVKVFGAEDKCVRDRLQALQLCIN